MIRKLPLVLVVAFIVACGQQTTGDSTTDNGTVVQLTSKAVEPIAAKSQGEKLFLLCAACHSLNNEPSKKVGPNLYQFMGKKAGQRVDFEYSEHLKSSGIVWDRTKLKSWIENPAALVPGTSMAFVGIQDKDRQEVLIDYIIEQTK